MVVVERLYVKTAGGRATATEDVNENTGVITELTVKAKRQAKHSKKHEALVHCNCYYTPSNSVVSPASLGRDFLRTSSWWVDTFWRLKIRKSLAAVEH
jgi:hypothetical protein